MKTKLILVTVVALLFVGCQDERELDFQVDTPLTRSGTNTITTGLDLVGIDGADLDNLHPQNQNAGFPHPIWKTYEFNVVPMLRGFVKFEIFNEDGSIADGDEIFALRRNFNLGGVASDLVFKLKPTNQSAGKTYTIVAENTSNQEIYYSRTFTVGSAEDDVDSVPPAGQWLENNSTNTPSKSRRVIGTAPYLAFVSEYGSTDAYIVDIIKGEKALNKRPFYKRFDYSTSQGQVKSIEFVDKKPEGYVEEWKYKTEYFYGTGVYSEFIRLFDRTEVGETLSEPHAIEYLNRLGFSNFVLEKDEAIKGYIVNLNVDGVNIEIKIYADSERGVPGYYEMDIEQYLVVQFKRI